NAMAMRASTPILSANKVGRSNKGVGTGYRLLKLPPLKHSHPPQKPGKSPTNTLDFFGPDRRHLGDCQGDPAGETVAAETKCRHLSVTECLPWEPSTSCATARPRLALKTTTSSVSAAGSRACNSAATGPRVGSCSTP